MKQIIVDLILIAILSFCMTNNFYISFKPLRIGIEHFNWGYSIGLFLILIGFFLSVGYAWHIGKKDSGYFDGYNDAIKDAVELLEERDSKQSK